ncbi:MAG: hypothetical protein Q8P41_14550 [Pseudomonadota bacterium]|nr:hypothetical protein [Pseudomonadota bacterium]
MAKERTPAKPEEKSAEKPQSKGEGEMSVREAGRMGGHKGGQRVKELVEEGKRLEEEQGGGRRGEE